MIAAAHESLMGSADALDLANILTHVGEAIIHVDSNWVVRYCNDVYLANLGMARGEVIGRTPFEYAPLFKRSIFYEAIEQCRVARKPMSRIGFSTVLNRWLMVRVFPLGDGMVMLANDASETVVKQYQLAQKVLRDPLTGLGNKLAMEQQVESLRRRDACFSIVVLGLDRFKEVNDAHGYATGDMVLLEVASSLQSATLGGETLYRVSGDEFAVIGEALEGVTDGEPDAAALATPKRAAALLAAVRTPIALPGIRVVLGACAGTVESPTDGEEYELLLKRAGLALREAKKGSRESVAAYRTELELASKMRAVLEAELRVALDGNQFRLVVQPKVALATGAVVGGEALIRWAHPKRGLLAPGAFLGIAQDIGAMVTIDHWVLRQTLKRIAAMAAQGSALPISINLSVDSLADQHLAERVRDALDDAAVAPGMLEVEIPEGALMRDVAASGRVLAELHAMGVRISIDDFGTGYSSLAYLARFPVDALKIDRSFVKDLGTGGDARPTAGATGETIVKAIVQLAHSLSLEVIAEGAEEPEQVAILRRLRCDSVQGFVIARPMSWPEFKAFAAANPGRKGPDPMCI